MTGNSNKQKQFVPDFTKLNKGDKRQIAYNYIKEAIMNNDLKPNQPLNDKELCEALGGLSRTPVRDAMRQLVFEGLIDDTPGRGMVVSKIYIEDILEISEIRSWLECGSVRLFIRRASKEMFEELGEIINAHKNAFLAKDFQKADKMDNEFHLFIAKGSMNSRVYTMLERIIADFVRGSFQKFDSEKRIELSIKYHERIYKAILDKDENLAVDESQKHMTDVMDYYKNVKINNYY